MSAPRNSLADSTEVIVSSQPPINDEEQSALMDQQKEVSPYKASEVVRILHEYLKTQSPLLESKIIEMKIATSPGSPSKAAYYYHQATNTTTNDKLVIAWPTNLTTGTHQPEPLFKEAIESILPDDKSIESNTQYLFPVILPPRKWLPAAADLLPSSALPETPVPHIILVHIDGATKTVKTYDPKEQGTVAQIIGPTLSSCLPSVVTDTAVPGFGRLGEEKAIGSIISYLTRDHQYIHCGRQKILNYTSCGIHATDMALVCVRALAQDESSIALIKKNLQVLDPSYQEYPNIIRAFQANYLERYNGSSTEINNRFSIFLKASAAVDSVIVLEEKTDTLYRNLKKLTQELLTTEDNFVNGAKAALLEISTAKNGPEKENLIASYKILTNTTEDKALRTFIETPDSAINASNLIDLTIHWKSWVKSLNKRWSECVLLTTNYPANSIKFSHIAHLPAPFQRLPRIELLLKEMLKTLNALEEAGEDITPSIKKPIETSLGDIRKFTMLANSGLTDEVLKTLVTTSQWKELNTISLQPLAAIPPTAATITADDQNTPHSPDSKAAQTSLKKAGKTCLTPAARATLGLDESIIPQQFSGTITSLPASPAKPTQSATATSPVITTAMLGKAIKALKPTESSALTGTKPVPAATESSDPASAELATPTTTSPSSTSSSSTTTTMSSASSSALESTTVTMAPAETAAPFSPPSETSATTTSADPSASSGVITNDNKQEATPALRVDTAEASGQSATTNSGEQKSAGPSHSATPQSSPSHSQHSPRQAGDNTAPSLPKENPLTTSPTQAPLQLNLAPTQIPPAKPSLWSRFSSFVSKHKKPLSILGLVISVPVLAVGLIGFFGWVPLVAALLTKLAWGLIAGAGLVVAFPSAAVGLHAMLCTSDDGSLADRDPTTVASTPHYAANDSKEEDATPSPASRLGVVPEDEKENSLPPNNSSSQLDSAASEIATPTSPGTGQAEITGLLTAAAPTSTSASANDELLPAAIREDVRRRGEYYLTQSMWPKDKMKKAKEALNPNPPYSNITPPKQNK